MEPKPTYNILKPCPFCGSDYRGTPHIDCTIYDVGSESKFRVECLNCDCVAAGGERNDTLDAVDAWNTRPIEDALRARIAELESAAAWISVSERLPERTYEDLGDEIIVYLDYPYNRTASMKFRNYDGRYEFYSGGWGSCMTIWNNHVTHWRPLPSAPEAE